MYGTTKDIVVNELKQLFEGHILKERKIETKSKVYPFVKTTELVNEELKSSPPIL